MSKKFLRPLWLSFVFITAACSALAGETGALGRIPGSPVPVGDATPTLVPSAAPQESSRLPESTIDPLILSPTPPPEPTNTYPPVPSPTPTTAPLPELRQLTSGGCCVQPFWAPDGQSLIYLDKPGESQPSGLWQISIDGGEPQFLTDRLGIFSPDLTLRAFPLNNQTVIEQLNTGQQFFINNGARAVSFSPDSQWIAWTGGETGPPFDTARREVWLSRTDGSQARPVFQIFGGGFAGWLLDGRILVSGRRAAGDIEQALYVLDPGNGDTFNAGIDELVARRALVELGRGARVRDPLPSPLGQWVAFHITFDPDPARNGLWVANTFTGRKTQVEPYGTFRWRNGDALLVIPLVLGEPQFLIQVDVAETGSDVALTSSLLTDPKVTSFSIANSDWNVSPDGNFINFLNAADQNIWVIKLP